MTAAQLLDKMADLESRIALIYERFATKFRDAHYVGELWDSMGREELHHADLLARLGRSIDATLGDGRLEQHVHELEGTVLRYEGEQAQIAHLQEALEATADLEEAEAEHLHAPLQELGESGRALAANPAFQHQTHGLLDHAIKLYGTVALRQRRAWHRFQR